MQIVKNGHKRVNFKKFKPKTFLKCVWREDASFKPLAASVSPTGWAVAMRKKQKNKRLVATPPLNWL